MPGGHIWLRRRRRGYLVPHSPTTGDDSASDQDVHGPPHGTTGHAEISRHFRLGVQNHPRGPRSVLDAAGNPLYELIVQGGSGRGVQPGKRCAAHSIGVRAGAAFDGTHDGMPSKVRWSIARVGAVSDKARVHCRQRVCGRPPEALSVVGGGPPLRYESVGGHHHPHRRWPHPRHHRCRSIAGTHRRTRGTSKTPRKPAQRLASYATDPRERHADRLSRHTWEATAARGRRGRLPETAGVVPCRWWGGPAPRALPNSLPRTSVKRCWQPSHKPRLETPTLLGRKRSRAQTHHAAGRSMRKRTPSGRCRRHPHHRRRRRDPRQRQKPQGTQSAHRGRTAPGHRDVPRQSGASISRHRKAEGRRHWHWAIEVARPGPAVRRARGRTHHSRNAAIPDQ